MGGDALAGVRLDLTDEAQVAAAFADAALNFGGLDIVVSNAGIASAAAVEDTSLALWERSIGILATDYFLVVREAFGLMRRQRLGGAIVFVASKNGRAASAAVSAYCTAKAAALHLAPDDIAEAVAFFASDRASKSTGNSVNVDAGNARYFTR